MQTRGPKGQIGVVTKTCLGMGEDTYNTPD